MPSLPFHLPPARSVPISFADAPVQNALVSLGLIDQRSGQQADGWPARIAALLTPEQRRSQRLIFELLVGALLPDQPYPNVPAYLVALAQADATWLRDRALAALSNEKDPAALLGDRVAFANAVHRQLPEVDADLIGEAYRLLNDPPTLQAHIVGHLRMLWDQYVASEWKRAFPVVPNLVHALQRRTFEPAPAAEMLSHFIPGDLPDAIIQQLAHIHTLVVVPTPHADLVATLFDDPTTLWLFVNVQTIWGWTLRQEPMRRAELRNRLDALADETRLQILELVGRAGELLAQEITAQLALTQPTASRHLSQLRGLGYLHERRVDSASKAYRINRSTFDWTARALGQLITGEGSADQREAQPATLRRFLDTAGRVTQLPTRQRDQQQVLDYLAAQFAPGETYNERAVNELLLAWHTFADPATLRRALVDARLLARTGDGARYWRNAPATPDESPS